MNKNYKAYWSLSFMGDECISPVSKVEEYVRKFGGVERFFDKILSSLEFPFGIINVDNFEVEVSNLGKFRSGMKCYELYCNKREKCKECPIDEVVKTGKRACIKKDKLDIFVFPIFEEGGKVVSVINYRIAQREATKKIVKEQIVEERNREHKKSFYNILQNSRDVVYQYNFVKGGFEYVSESVFTLMGFPLGEFIRMSYKDFLDRVHPEDMDRACEINSGEDETICESEYRWKCKDGKYRWFLDRRTWFFNESGRRTCVVGDIKDITLDKEREEEKLVLEKRIALMKRQDVETSKRVGLMDREKIVLWGFCRWPLLNDEELARKLELKRSTLTAIRNRLSGKGWFSLKYIPNFAKLGCEFAGVFSGTTSGGRSRKLDLRLLKKTPWVILNNYQDEKFFGIFVSDKYVEFRRFLEMFGEENSEALKVGFSENSFFYDLENFELRDFSGVVNSLFDLGRNEKAKVFDFKGEVGELNVNEKRVLHAMTLNPEMSSSEIAKKVWISKPTVIKIRNRLIDEGFVYVVVVPDFKKLGLEYFGKFVYESESELPPEVKRNGDISRTVLKVSGKKRVVKFVLFSSEKEYVEEVDLIREMYSRNRIYFKLDSEVFAIQKRGKGNFDLGSFLGEFLFEE